jgi:G:T-mismatch repair DNA endonuclease (very short patch repair protein)
MQAVKSNDTAPELSVRRMVHAMRHRFGCIAPTSRESPIDERTIEALRAMGWKTS